ncbi:phage tail tape measure C-terminal domain-containing protein [Pseudosulfitobacter pseudonitzschiae]|uniref:phage tail tape measure C-terminal domain-containing protein n=1 Tax=Pseudosulfitobacter pseudonitzschiae TaxID=1402135 RepID=UPI001CD78011|nr:phage tail tape measure C-terminal domain-containing protein [Pseudosulfitobacter pseudonitzschiae]
MGQSVIGALRVNLGLDSAKFEKGAGAADRSLQKMKLQFAAVAGAAAAFGAALSTAALAGAKQIDEAAKAARRLDSSIGGFRALELSAGEAGVSLSGLTNDIQTMNRELASVGVSGNGKRALEALGLELSDLQGIDADEKLAVIADRVKALGLSSGKTTAILRDLGVRNREMALLVLQGGDAIRNARADIKAYGLEVSKFDASAIETANDQIGRLGLIGQYAGQQLAIALVPTLGALAQTMTDSLKEGGLLRAMIDGFTQNLSAFAGVAAVASTAFGVRYVGALVLAKVATFSLSGAVIALRGALVSTGIGAVVVAAGVLVGKFADLVASTGGFGNALTLLGEVAAGVWDGITISAGAIPPALNSVWKLVQSGFFEMMSHIQENWSRFLGNLGQDLAEVPGLGKAADAVLQASGASSAAMSEFNAMAQSAANSAAALKAEAGALATEGFDRAREAAAKLSTVVEETGETTDSLNEVLDETGAAGGKAAKGAKKASKALSEAEKEAKRLREEMQRPLVNAIGGVADAFGDFVSRGFKDFKGFAKSIVGGFQQMISQMIGLAARNRIMLSMGLTGRWRRGCSGGCAWAGAGRRHLWRSWWRWRTAGGLGWHRQRAYGRLHELDRFALQRWHRRHVWQHWCATGHRFCNRHRHSYRGRHRRDRSTAAGSGSGVLVLQKEGNRTGCRPADHGRWHGCAGRDVPDDRDKAVLGFKQEGRDVLQ